MCGFVGFFNNDSDEARNRAVIKVMADRIIHRGPDEDGYYVDDKVSLGHRRLSIIGLEGGGQPIYNEDGSLVLVYNGEIYNYKELKEDLIAKGHVFTTKTDSETLLHGYEEYGKDFLKKLRGMFAFVIWDKNNSKIFGARDIFGIKPFFYFLKDSKFMFASEIKAFLSNPDFEKELNRDRIPEYLCFEYIPSNETLFKNVFKVEPASYFEYENGELKTGKYFEMKYDIDETKTLDEWEEIVADTFRKSTEAHCVADVEVGCFLSGGVDSSYTVCEVSKNNPVKTFTVGYTEEKYSELSNAQEFAKAMNIRNYSKLISADEYFNIVPKVQYYMDEPLPNPSAISLYFLARLASEQVKVVLSGEGADELFGGYWYYLDPLEFEDYQKKVPLFIRKAGALVAAVLPTGFHGKRFLTRGAQTIDEYFIRNNYVYNWKERKNILNPNIPAPNPKEFTKPYFEKCKELDGVTQMQYVDMQTWLVQDILVKADRMSMAHSLELRVPFLDREMLALALKLPTRYRMTKDGAKIALRGAAIKQIPAKSAKMKKSGFLTPLNDWLKQDKFYNMVDEKFRSDIAKEFFNIDFITGLLEDHKAGKAKNMKKIWSIYSFLHWYEQYFVLN